MTWIKDGLRPPHNFGYKMGRLTREVLERVAKDMKANPPKRSWVIYPPIEWVWATEFKEKTNMEKLEIKMARFVELSMKFSVAEDLIEEIQDLKDLVLPTYNIDGGTLTTTGPQGDIWLGDRILPKQEEIEEEKSFRAKVEEGVTKRWKIYEEYQEYLRLQKTLNEYFKAADKL